MSEKVTVTLAEFREICPAFNDVELYPDSLLRPVLKNAQVYISPVNGMGLTRTARELAIYLMTAHLQTLSDLIKSGGTQGTVIASSSIDAISVSLVPPPARNQREYWYNMTIYGQQLLPLLQMKAAPGIYLGGEYEQVFR